MADKKIDFRQWVIKTKLNLIVILGVAKIGNLIIDKRFRIFYLFFWMIANKIPVRSSSQPRQDGGVMT